MPHAQKEAHNHASFSKKAKKQQLLEKAAKKQALVDAAAALAAADAALKLGNNLSLKEGFGEYEVGCEPEREYKFNTKKRNKKHLKEDLRKKELLAEEEEKARVKAAADAATAAAASGASSSSSESEEEITIELLVYICEYVRERSEHISLTSEMREKRACRATQNVPRAAKNRVAHSLNLLSLARPVLTLALFVSHQPER